MNDQGLPLIKRHLLYSSASRFWQLTSSLHDATRSPKRTAIWKSHQAAFLYLWFSSHFLIPKVFFLKEKGSHLWLPYNAFFLNINKKNALKIQGNFIKIKCSQKEALVTLTKWLKCLPTSVSFIYASFYINNRIIKKKKPFKIKFNSRKKLLNFT